MYVYYIINQLRVVMCCALFFKALHTNVQDLKDARLIILRS